MHINTANLSHDVSPMSSPTLSRVNSRHSAVSSVDESPEVSPVFSSSTYPINGVGSVARSDTATTPSIEHSCTLDTEDWFGRFRDDLDISDECPDRGTLAAAGEVPLYDAHGNMRHFKSLFTGLDAIGDRQLVIFIRHFYCGACQAFLQALAAEITMQTYYTMPIPTSIVVIGCGLPSLIPAYKAVTGCPFPIFAEPSRKLFRILGMSWSLNIGTKRPEYMKEISPPAWLLEQFRQMAKTKGPKKWKAGNWLQIGGEFLFQDGQAVWCHRMKNYRNHAEIKTLKRLLDIED